jgi:GNAT superfamily N-acetyltransferase
MDRDIRIDEHIQRVLYAVNPYEIGNTLVRQLCVNFVKVKASDIDDLITIRIEAMRDSLERLGRFDPVLARARFQSAFSPKHTHYIVVNFKRIGFVVIKPEAGYLILDHLYLLPEAQNKGIGTEVLIRVFAIADASVLPVQVGALRNSNSNRFYVRHGFQLVAEHEFDNYYIRHSQTKLLT